MRTFGGISVLSVGRILIALLLLWFTFVFFIGGPLFRRSGTDSDGYSSSQDNTELIMARLSKASSELESLKIQNQELRRMIDNLIPFKGGRISREDSSISSVDSAIPSFSYELTRRRIHSNIDELWNYVKHYLSAPQQKFVSELRHNLLYDLQVMDSRDDEWRAHELSSLGQYVQNVIINLQNPKSCETARKLVCQLNKGCGFGCQIHHVVYCFVVGLAENRTVILNARNWRYMSPEHKKSKAGGWNLIFQPLSQNCIDEGKAGRTSWKTGHEEYQILDLPIIDSLRPRPEYLPLAIPEQIAHKLEQLHGNPISWFLGQITRYVMRLSEDMEQFITDAKYRVNFRTPIVGIHVRRTDKVGSEASFHPLSEYMVHVNDFYDKQNVERLRSNSAADQPEKLVYLATDDPGIWTKETQTFEDKGFQFLGDSDVANSAGIGTRYGVDSLRNVILDIWLLSECNHLVCTFSSQVCRVAYELMQTRPGINISSTDWSFAYNSLDDIYYFGGQSDHNQVAIITHESQRSDEISLSPGDIVGIAGNHWNGYSKGVNRQTHKNGLYPSFKTVEKVKTFPFKAFDKHH